MGGDVRDSLIVLAGRLCERPLGRMRIIPEHGRPGCPGESDTAGKKRQQADGHDASSQTSHQHTLSKSLETFAVWGDFRAPTHAAGYHNQAHAPVNRAASRGVRVIRARHGVVFTAPYQSFCVRIASICSKSYCWPLSIPGQFFPVSCQASGLLRTPSQKGQVRHCSGLTG
jgi:hypothetical protein